MNGTWLDFEKPIIELERKIEELKSRAGGDERETAEELRPPREARPTGSARTSSPSSTRWQRVKLARHPRRPYTLDYLKVIAPQFMELHGDRRFADDPAIVRRPRDARRPSGRPPGTPEGTRYEGEHPPELRHGESGGVPEGAPPDAHGRDVRIPRS